MSDTTKKKVLFVYYEMMVGGSTTSLLSLLNEFDYDKYDVDLLLYRHEGLFSSYLSLKAKLLPEAYDSQIKAKNNINKIKDYTIENMAECHLNVLRELKANLW